MGTETHFKSQISNNLQFSVPGSTCREPWCPRVSTAPEQCCYTSVESLEFQGGWADLGTHRRDVLFTVILQR